jgi:hypothetical protein
VPFGGMVYAFSAILAIYLAGITLGAAVASRILKRWRAGRALWNPAGFARGGRGAWAHLFDSHWQAAVIGHANGSTASFSGAKPESPRASSSPPAFSSVRSSRRPS